MKGTRKSESGSRKWVLGLLICIVSLSSFAQKKNLNIVYIGDSITQGVELDDPAKEAPPAIATAWLRKQKGLGKVEFSNQGVSGFTTVDFLPSTNTVFPRADKAALALNSEDATLVFFIMLGTNDSAIAGPNGASVSPEKYHDNLKTINDRLLQHFPKSKFIIQKPIWYSPNTYNGSMYLQEGLSRLQSYFHRIELLVSEYKSTNPGHIFATDTKAFDYFSQHYSTDLIPEQGHEGIFYLHPNSKGAIILGQFWGEAIYNILMKN
ncbi:GDSL-type esterase/lipase family protein [Mucilaginibacter sp. BT774]|nr:GDSL-type esterase/lipase family protein [Mucilaginibacter sp. BT774]